ncbi:gamma-glutamyltransferase family protein [Frondihabitans cladoniiphilus]|uniref:Gamma-glutamyltransferase n=1 Tax=Frondihabitans cladoniiphilus TaxID=715785 RepID=A0ABP8W1N6_9MICO
MPFTPPDAHRTRPVLRGSFGMVAATHWLASASAQSVLERGGTAIDAAVSAAFVLHVVEPHLNGPGGDLSLIYSTADDPGPHVVSGQGPTPEGATIEHFRREGLDLVPGAGALAATVPGGVPSWLMLLAEHGTWELRGVFEHAIHYARNGHPLLPSAARTIATVQELFTEHWPTSRDQWLVDGEPPEPDSIVTNEAYARTLERLLAAGDEAAAPLGDSTAGREARILGALDAWRSGFVAEAIERFVATPHRHSTGGDHAGVLRASDLAAFTPAVEEATTLAFRGVTVAKTGAWGQGPVLLQTLAILDTFDDEHLDPSTELGVHTITEALKLALADRDAYYGDPGPDEQPVPLDVLLSPEYARERAALIGPEASTEFRPGRVPGRTAFLPPLVEEHASPTSGRAGTGEPTVRVTGETRGDTCHVDVVDRFGTMVSATPSGGWLQSSPTIPELGFCLGTRLQMSWLDESSPSRLRPGRRPRTTLSPTMLLVDGRAAEALGTPGGDQQDQWQLLYLLRTIVGGYDPQQAIDAPMFHTTHLAGSFWPRTWEPAGLVVETRLGADVLDGLARRGHRITRAGDWALGRLSMVGVDPATGLLRAAATSRGSQGYAAGR